ncbi:hypothetical protein PV325_009331 [Microctonus aethiopoides]|nr:hypothetical protein PV325_009331 [Microctonus aethiopoides]
MDTTTGQDGSIPAGSSVPKDSVKKRSRCGSAMKRARKAKAERELQSASHTELTPNVKVPQPGGSLVESNDCGGGTGDKDGTTPINLKRRRNETVTPPEIRKQVKKNRGAQPLRIREAVLADRSLAIVPVGYPERSLKREEGELLTRALLGAIDAIPKEMVVMRFEGNQRERGIQWVTCADTAAKEWLKSIVPSLKPWDGACLEILDKERICRSKKMTAIFRDTNE